MTDLKKMTVRALRDLARRHVGPGYSRLKTKSELIGALAKVLPKTLQDVLEVEPPAPATPAAPARAAAAPEAAAAAEAARAGERPATPAVPAAAVAVPPAAIAVAPAPLARAERVEDQEAVEAKQPLAAAANGPAAAVTVGMVKGPGKPPSTHAHPEPSTVVTGHAGRDSAPVAEPAPRKAPRPAPLAALPIEPDPEGHLVARVAGEAVAREAQIPLVEEKVPPQPSAPPEVGFDEQLGELPDSYGEDSVVLLPKDPYSVYAYWEFAPETVRRAFDSLPGPHAKLRVHAENQLVREIDFALESHSWYLHGLEPGRVYRVELVAVGSDGRSRRIGPVSNPLRLPGEGPSPIIDDRFVRIPFDVPSARVAEAVKQAVENPPPVPFPDELRERLYDLSGGTMRAIGSSENPIPGSGPEGAHGGGAGGGQAEGSGETRRGGPTGVRSSGPWPWSGTVPRRSS